eukprot:m.262666 g.262666  ORF g.262666 m.262666 type:complete len:136 (+) comp16223_c0_seq5:1557-1964(+)
MQFCLLTDAKPLFVATDDRNVKFETLTAANMSNISNTRIVFNEKALQTETVCRNFGIKCTTEVVKDIMRLRYSDLLVCTFSSQICRLAHELRCADRGPIQCALDTVTLDDKYYANGWCVKVSASGIRPVACNTEN